MKKMCIVYKHCVGHHLIFAIEIIRYLEKKGYKIFFLVNKNCKQNIMKIDFYKKYKTSISYVSFNKIDLMSVRKIFKFIVNNNINIIFFPTLDEWLVDIQFSIYKKLLLKKNIEIIGILHYLKKNRQNIFYKMYEYMSVKSLYWLINNENFKLVVMNKDILSQYKKLKASSFLLKHPINKPENYVHKVNKENIKLLLFGEISSKKNIEKILYLFKTLDTKYQLQIVGKFEKSYEKRVMHLINEQDNIIINNNYVSESLKKQYYIESDIVIIPYTNSLYSNGMESGVLYDAINFSKPIIFPEEFDKSNILNFGQQFSFKDPITFKKAINKIITNYNKYQNNIYNFKISMYNDFIKGLNEIF